MSNAFQKTIKSIIVGFISTSLLVVFVACGEDGDLGGSGSGSKGSSGNKNNSTGNNSTNDNANNNANNNTASNSSTNNKKKCFPNPLPGQVPCVES